MQRRVEMDLRESSEAQVHRKIEAHRLEQEIQMRERLAESRRVHEEKFQKLLDEESSSLESEMRSDVEARIKVLEEASERNSLSELERRFRSERETMEAALALRRQEMALEMEVEMEQRVAEARRKESEMMANLEDKLSRKEDLSKRRSKRSSKA